MAPTQARAPHRAVIACATTTKAFSGNRSTAGVGDELAATPCTHPQYRPHTWKDACFSWCNAEG